MKVIDLLNKIANGEEVPKKIRFDNINWNKVYGEKYMYYKNDYDDDFFLYFFRKNLDFTLNDEVEIIEEDKKIEPKPITKKDLEAIGYAFGEMKKALQNGWDKSLKNEPFKEDKKIDHLSYEETSLWVDNEDGKKPVETIVAINNKKLVNKINEIIDYINKGDK